MAIHSAHLVDVELLLIPSTINGVLDTVMKAVYMMTQVLFMKKPDDGDSEVDEIDWSQAHHELMQHANPYSKRPRTAGGRGQGFNPVGGGGSLSSSLAGVDTSQLDISRLCQHCGDRQDGGRGSTSSPNVIKGLQGIAFIAKHFSETDQATRVSETPMK